MAIPKRKRLINSRTRTDNKIGFKKEEKPISEEEHQERLRKLKELGLLK